MTTVTLTYEKVLESLERAVTEKGEDYVYERPVADGCRYAVPVSAEPSCLVGHVFAELAPELFEALLDYEATYATSLAVSDVNRELEGYGGPNELHIEGDVVYRLEPAAASLLDAAQGLQDEGSSWGEVLESVRRR